MTPALSLAICTHNPRPDHLQRTLRSLQAQTMPKADWELLVIDNASTNGVVDEQDLSAFPGARVVKEPRIGLTMARIRGIEEAAAELLLFVDDDNELAPDYLANAVEIANAHPSLGVFGSGRLVPEYEEDPDPALLPHVVMLALREVPATHWSNDPRDGKIPWGAGMAVRRTVATRYRDIILADPEKQRLDRSGNTLNSCGDDEFSWVACEMGLGKGVFKELSVIHLIGKSRVQKEYLLRLAEGHAYSRSLLAKLHGLPVAKPMLLPSAGRVLSSLFRLRISEFLHEAARWMDWRTLSEVDRTFHRVKVAGIERFLRLSDV